MNRTLIAAFLGSLALLVAAGVTGCQAPPPAGVQDPYPEYPKITVERPLQRYLAVNYEAIVVDPATDSEPLTVTVPVRSMADNQMIVQYRYLWADDRGRFTQDTGWRMAVVEPRLQVHLTANAISTRMKDWRLEVRSAR